MPLWGAAEGSEALPKFLTTAQQKDVFANQSGWVVEAGSAMTGNGNTSADPEVLVAIGGLAGNTGTTGLGEATIQSVNWNITTFDKSAGGTLSVTVRWNEAVTVAVSNPTLVVTNDTNSNHTLTYASGSGTHELTFTLAIGAANAATDADDVLSIAAQNITLASSSTIKDTGSTPTNAERAISSAHGTACGTITVVA
jgi:hypothetical protein